MLPKTYIYPAFFYYDSDGISIEFPDIPGCLPCAHSSEEAFKNAREALGLHMYSMEQDGDDIPVPSDPKQLHPDDGGVVVMIESFMPAIRDQVQNRYVKKTLSLPAWLNRAAEEANVNFSQILQDSLKEYLDLDRQQHTQ